MKIAFVAQPFDGVIPPYQNSIGLIIYNSARQLAANNSVTVYLPKKDWVDTVKEEDGIVFRPIPIGPDQRLLRVLDRVPKMLNQSEAFASWIYYLHYISKIALDARRHDFDVLHMINFSQFAPVVKRLNPATKVVLEMQCEWLAQLDHRMIEKRLASVDLVTGVSDHITNGVLASFPDLEIPCLTAYNGVDPERFRLEQDHSGNPPDLSKTILFIGRVSPEKGVHVLVDAMAEVVRQVPDARLLIVGGRSQLPLDYIVGLTDDKELRGLSVFYDGTLAENYNAYLDKRVKELNLGNSIEFTGGMPQAELISLYHRARLLVNPSYSESFGMSVVEGMAVKLPIVATRVGGMKETVEHGKTGFLVEKGNAEDLGEALVRLLKDDQLCLEMGSKGYERALNSFSWEKRAGDLMGYYQDLLPRG